MKRLKTIEKEEAQDGEIVESSWDAKKIAVGIFILVVLMILGSYFVKPFPLSENKSVSVLGTSDEVSKEVPPLPSREDVQAIVANAKETLSQITSENLTSSEAAIQKIVSDLESLQGKKDAVGAFCALVCKDRE